MATSEEKLPARVHPVEPRAAAAAPPGLRRHVGPRQWVSFTMYQLDPAFRRLEDAAKTSARDEFLAAYQKGKAEAMLLYSYSLVGLRRDVDFMLWRITHDPADLQSHTAAINHTVLGAYLRTNYSLLSMSRRSIYVDKLDPGHGETRARICPGNRKHLFVYPFVKNRPWYLLPLERRQAMMDQHIAVGSRYPSVHLHTTYSFGIDDQEFVVSFETDEPKDFLDLVQELRETQASEYTHRDTPMFSGIRMDMARILEQLW